MTKSRYTEEQIIGILKQHQAGLGAKELCRKHGIIESFNGRLRDECPNEHLFTNLSEARRIIEAWQIDYNTRRPHSSLNGLTPTEFAARPFEGHNQNRDFHKRGHTGGQVTRYNRLTWCGSTRWPKVRVQSPLLLKRSPLRIGLRIS